MLFSAFLLLAATAIAVSSANQKRDDARFSFFPLKTPLSGPCDLVEGPDGALWGEAILVNHIFRVDPDTGDVEEYTIPFTTPISNQTLPDILPIVQDRTALSCAIRKGADGNLYASNGLRNQLVKIDPTTKAIEILQPPPNILGDLQPFNDIYTAENGIYFTQTTGNVFTFFSFETQNFTNYNVPTPLALPLGLYVDSKGIVWIAELLGNKILTFNPATEEINEYPLPELLQFPAVVRAEKDGYIYFSLFIGNGIGRISQETYEIEIFHTDQLLGLGAEDTIDASGGVWLSFFDVDVLARLDTDNLTFSYTPFPNALADSGLNGILGDLPPYVDVAVNYGPGNAVWFTDISGNRVGRYNLDDLY